MGIDRQGRWTLVGKVISLLFNTLSRLVITFLPRKRKFNGDPEWAERTLAVCLVHDVPVSAGWIDAKTVDRWWVIKEKLELWNAKFTGYWFDGAAKGFSEGLLSSRYELPPSAPYRQLVVVSNFSRADTALGAGELPGGAVRELWSGRDLSPATANSTTEATSVRDIVVRMKSVLRSVSPTTSNPKKMVQLPFVTVIPWLRSA